QSVSKLEERIASLAEAVQARGDAGHRPEDVEAVVRGLSEKIERLQLNRGDNVALNQLEDRIVKLVEKLDASDAKLGHLEAIERGLAELLVHVDNKRGNSGAPLATS